MDFGYYDEQALLVLRRPIVLSGPFAVETRQVGRRLAALYGLRFRDLSQLVEHAEGTSYDQVAAHSASDDFEALQAELLRRAVLELPAGIVSLREEALELAAVRQLVRQNSYFVALQYPFDDFFDRYPGLERRALPSWALDTRCSQELEERYSDRLEELAGGAKLVLDMAGLPAARAVQSLVNRLERDVESGFAVS